MHHALDLWSMVHTLYVRHGDSFVTKQSITVLLCFVNKACPIGLCKTVIDRLSFNIVLVKRRHRWPQLVAEGGHAGCCEQRRKDPQPHSAELLGREGGVVQGIEVQAAEAPNCRGAGRATTASL